MTFTGDIDLSVVAQGYEEDIQINVNRGNSLIYQSKDISVKENELSIATSGLGCALVQVGRFSWHQFWRKWIITGRTIRLLVQEGNEKLWYLTVFETRTQLTTVTYYNFLLSLLTTQNHNCTKLFTFIHCSCCWLPQNRKKGY